MPKKVCCCNSCRTGYPTSCCKAPARVCEDQDVSITLDFYVKFYCRPNGGTLQWRCQNGATVPLNIQTEKWRLNFTYRISRFDTVPPLPRIGNDFLNALKINTLQPLVTASSSQTWFGGYGYLGGVVQGDVYDRPPGQQPIYSRCPKCVDVCDENNQLKGCERISYIDNQTQERVERCGIFKPDGGGFGNFGFFELVECSDCCYFGNAPDIYEKYNYIPLNTEEYHACDLCDDGTVLSDSMEGSFNYGVYPATVFDELTGVSFKVTDFDLSLRDNSTWNFEFIPLFEGQQSKLDISLLSMHWGCSTQGVNDQYNTEYPSTFNALTNNFLFNSDTRPFPLRSWIDSPYVNTGIANPGLSGSVDIIEDTYIKPETTLDDFINLLCPCTPFECRTTSASQCINEILPRPRPKRFINCNCDCFRPYSCYSLFHLNPSPFDGFNNLNPSQSGSRPHQIDFEIGIGYRDTLPCGDEITMDFWESLYRLDFLANTQTEVPRDVTSTDGKTVNNPEWYDALANFPTPEYAFYGQGMKMHLVYTRNSIPYESYNFENHEKGTNCFAASWRSEPTPGGAPFIDINKPYQNYPPPQHPSYSQYNGVVYEGEYALSKVSGWYPVVSGYETNYLGFTSGSFNPFNAFSPITPPVSVEDFNRCYPFRFPQGGLGQTTFAISNFPRIISDNPASFPFYINRGTLAYNYSYGELTALVEES
jgi:hypothetical protein